MKKPIVDAIDRQILSLLQENSGITNKALAQAIGLTPGPTLTRVQNLIKRGFIANYKVTLNPENLGYSHMVFCAVEIFSDNADAVRTTLEQTPSIYSLFEVASSLQRIPDVKMFLFQMYLGEAESSNKFVENALVSLPGVVHYEIFDHVNTIREGKFLLPE